jgi:hypothetical protein
MRIMWLEYLRARQATESDVVDTERHLGLSLPPDMAAFLLKYQGMRSETAAVTDSRGHLIRVGHLFFLTDAAESGQRNIRDLCLLFRKRGYPTTFVPFASAGGQPHLALDYSGPTGEVSVAYVYPDGDAPQTGFWSKTAVAPDVATFLAMLQRTGDL